MRITFGGLASGLDTNALIDGLMGVERIPLQRLQSRRSEIQDEQSRFQKLNSLLLGVRDAARALDNRTDLLASASPDEEFLAFQASSSNESVLTVTADGQGNASPGAVDVRVSQLARPARRVSAAYGASTDVVGQAGDTLQIDFGGAQPIALTLAAGTTLAGLRDAINDDANNDGSVRAELLDDGNGSVRLILSGRDAGVSHDITVTSSITAPGGGSFEDAALSQAAQNAQLDVFGVSIQRETNDIDDAIPGVTLHLVGVNDPATPTDQVSIQVSRDDDAIAEKLQALVDAYNEVRSFMQDQRAVDPETNRAGPLSGDSTLRGIERTLQQSLGASYTFAGNAFTTLSSVGVRFDSKGKLSLDRQVLNDALEQDPLAVRELLSGDGTTDGAATALARSLEPILRAGDGTLAVREDGFADRIDDLDDRIDRMQERLDQKEEALIARFTQLESLLAGLQNQSLFLSGFGGNQ